MKSITTIILVLFQMQLVLAQSADISSNLIGYWQLDEGRGLLFTDASGNGLSGQVNSGVWTEGKYGKALQFNGTQYSRIPYASLMDKADKEFTIACWVKSLSEKQNFYSLIFNRPTTNNSVFECFALQVRDGKWSSSVTVSPHTDEFKPLDGTEADTDIWHHLAMTYDGHDEILNLDGKQVAIQAINKDEINYIQNFDLIVGANINNGSNVHDHFIGAVDEMRIYSRALSSNDIKVLSAFDPTQTSLKEKNGSNESIRQWEIFELSLKGPETGNPFLDVTLEATFSLGAKTITPQGFYDGNGIYKIRFMADALGEWSYKTKSNEKALDGVKGLLTCIESPNDMHGPVRVVDRYHFAYADGKRFFPVGTTLYCWQLERYDETLTTLKNAGINKVRFMTFPHGRNDEGEGNSFPPFNPWEGSVNNWDYDRPNPKFWQFIENAVRDLGEWGIQADFIFFHPYETGERQTWGLGPEMMTETQRKNFLSYAVRRLAAYNNIWWSMANEYNLIDTSLTYWEPLAETVANSDPYGHMRSIHNLPGKYYPGWNNHWVTHISIQDPDVLKISEWRKQYQKPVIDDEYEYDGNWEPWGNLTAEEATRRIWIATIEGGYATHGEAYKPYSFFWKGGTPQRSSFARVSWLSEEVLNNDYKPLPGGLTPIDSVSAKVGSDYFLYYFGNEVTSEMTITVSEGKEYMVDVLDTWNMTVKEQGIYSGTFKIRWPSGKYMAVRIYRSITK
jgi:hypothetical protein